MHFIKTNFSLKGRLLSIVSLQIVLVLLFMFSSLIIATTRIFSSYSTETDQMNRSIISQLRFQFDEMAGISELPSVTVNGSYSALNNALNDSEIWTSQMSYMVRSDFQSYIDSSTFIDTLCICNTNGIGIFLQNDIFNFYDCEADVHSEWFSNIIHSKGEAIAFANVSAADTGILKRTRSGKIYETSATGISRAIRNPFTSENIGVITLTIDPLNILSEFWDNRIYENQEMVLYLGDSLLAASDEKTSPYISHQKKHISFSIIHACPYIVNYQENELFSCWIYTPLQDVFGNSILLFLIILLDIFLFSLVIASVNRTIKSIARPLNTLTEACRQFSIDTGIKLNMDDAPDEFKPLFSTFNEMYNRIDKLIEDNYIKDIEQNKLEIQYLRAQINPHYLYNTLECLHLMAYSAKNYDVALMAELLGKNLQYGLNARTQEVSLETEFGKVREYVDLISFNYKDRIQVQYGIDSGILPSLTLRLIIQPVLENSYVHGLSKEFGKLTIEILGYRLDENVLIKIYDDGAGIPPEKLKKLQEQLASNHPSDSIGLNNVNRRIKLFYGQQYGLQVDSRPSQGTLVTITLPYHEKAWEQKEAKECV